mgnify:CR=1 FL=1
MKTTKTYTTTSREYIYTGLGDEDVRPGVDAEIWYEGEDKAEALRIAAKYASDCGKGDTGALEICKRGISRQIFEVEELTLNEDEDVIEDDTIEVIDPLDRQPGLRKFAREAYRTNCDLVSYIVGESEDVDTIEIDGGFYSLYHVQDSAFGNFDCYYYNDSELYLPCSFDDYRLETVDDLKDALENADGLFWSSIDIKTELDQLYYDLFKESI